jgi:peptidoglycan/LPS O-acetylase OafA/YrhL
MYQHFWSEDNAGQLGVRLFFVLSGFLITSNLLAQKDSAGSYSDKFKTFYARRILRIWPIYYLVLGVSWASNLFGINDSLIWHLTHVSNYYYIFKSDWQPTVTAHFWTLGVEEQFYLFWPVVILLVPRRALLGVLLLTIATAVLYRLFIHHTGLSANYFYGLATPGAFDALGLGGLLAWLRHSGFDLSRLRKWLVPLALSILSGILLLNHLDFALTLYFLKDSLISLVLAAIIVGSVIGMPGLWGRILEWGPIVYVGKISYGVYLYHNFVSHLSGKVLGRFGFESELGPLNFILMSAGTILVASASWYLIEKPVNSLKRYFPYTRTKATAPEASAAGLAERPRSTLDLP